MVRSLLTLAAGLALTLTAAAQPAKLAAPKLVEEGGKKVLVFTAGETAMDVTVGDVKYTFQPLGVHATTKVFHVGYELTLVGKAGSVAVREVGISATDWTVSDLDGELKSSIVVGTPGRDLKAGSKPWWLRSYYAVPKDWKAIEVRVEMPAKGGEAAVWRVVYPKKSWVKGDPVPSG